MEVYRIFALPSLMCAIFSAWLVVEFAFSSKKQNAEDFWFGILLFIVAWRLFFASLAMNSTDPALSIQLERTGYIAFILMIPIMPIFVHSVIKSKNKMILLVFLLSGLSLLPFTYSEHFVSSSDYITYTVFGIPNTEHYSGSSRIIHRIFSFFVFTSAIYCQVVMIRYIKRNPREKYAISITVGMLVATITGLFDLISMLVPLSTPAFFEYGIFFLVSLTAYSLSVRKRNERESAFEEVKIAKHELELYSENLEVKVSERTKELRDERDKVIRAQNVLSKYISPQLTAKVLSDQIELVWGHDRRKLTLFFSDIKDFTRITDGMEPEDMVNLLNEYLSNMLNIVIKHGGTLASISGDGLFVFFGAPDATNDKDHAMRCLRMAIEMQSTLKDLNNKWYNAGFEEPLRIRIGINTGVATVGGYGSQDRREYTAMGMQVNLASRLENVCEEGKILVSHSTWAMTNDTFNFEEKGMVEVKGCHKPIKTYYYRGNYT